MGGKPPLTVITDQDGAMEKAIVKVIPEANHRLCLWHLARNRASGTGNEAFMAGFNKLVEKDCMENEFNVKWNKLVATHELEDNSWIRATWLVALEQSAASKFTKEAFVEFKKQLGMSTTCICENKEIAGHLELYNFRT
ncbi:Protein FAR-RED IMPAIRED RESPONSE 1 [Linum grandiflorum]